ncbi:MAG: hypothetical protein ACRELT_04225, partial [Longimicrobiales bacterium]
MTASIAEPTEARAATAVEPWWRAAAHSARSPFHTQQLCEVLDRSWPGEHAACHVELDTGGASSIVPAFVYRSCPRLEYYRHAVGTHLAPEWPMMLSHSLAGWYGCPAGTNADCRRAAVAEFTRRAESLSLPAIFAGIDERDEGTIADLGRAGYHLEHFHTLM